MKKIFEFLIAVTFLMVLTISAKAQQPLSLKNDTIDWQYGTGENKSKVEALSISGRFISYAEKGFRWIQNGTSKEYYFEVKSVNGSWSDMSKTGTVEYQAVCEGISGTIRLYRTGGNVSIHLDFSQRDKLTPNVVFQVSSFSKI